MKTLTRRELLERSLALAAVGAAAPLQSLRAQPAVDDLVEFRRVVAANRILSNEAVVDGFGHVSVRDPRDPGRYVMSRSLSPEFV